jgi:hypothetical protein
MTDVHNSIPLQAVTCTQQYGNRCDAASSQLAGYHIHHIVLSSIFDNQGHSSGPSLHARQSGLIF